MLAESEGCFQTQNANGDRITPLPDFSSALESLKKAVAPFIKTLAKDGTHSEVWSEINTAIPAFTKDVEAFKSESTKQQVAWKKQKTSNGEPKKTVDRLSTLAESSRNLVKQTDLLFKLSTRLIKTCENECSARESSTWLGKEITKARKLADEARSLAVEQLKKIRYF